MEEATLPEISAPAGIDRDNETLLQIVEHSMSEVRGHLSENREHAKSMTDVSETLDNVLSNDNIREVDVRARPFENPKVTFWLGHCPIWANDAWRETGFPFGVNAYNGKVTMTFDVREF